MVFHQTMEKCPAVYTILCDEYFIVSAIPVCIINSRGRRQTASECFGIFFNVVSITMYKIMPIYLMFLQ